MDCEEARALIPDILRGGEGMERAAWDRHAATCPACRDEAARMRRAFDLARQAVGELTPSPESWRRLGDEWARRRKIRRWIGVGAVFLALILTVLAWLYLARP